MIINYHILNDNVIWMQIPKVASTFISQTLIKERRLKNEYERMDCDDVIEFNRIIVYLVRNPFDRLVSNYLNRVVKYKKLIHEELLDTSFEEFVTKLVTIPHKELDIHLRPIYLFEEIIKIKNSDIKWYKIEDNPLNIIEELGGFKLNQEVFKNITKDRKHYRDYYNDNTKKLITEYYNEDLIKYNYNF